MLQKRDGRIRNPIICHLAVMIVPSIPCSATTAAVCRPRPRVTEYDTSAVAMMLRACSITSAVLITDDHVKNILTSEKKMKTSSQPGCLTISIRVKILREVVAIAIPVHTHQMTLICVARLSLKSTSVLRLAIVMVAERVGQS